MQSREGNAARRFSSPRQPSRGASRNPEQVRRMLPFVLEPRDRPMKDDFYRIKRLPPYVFAEVNALKARARAAGRDVIDLGMGNPDGPTPEHIVKKLVDAVQDR